MYPTVIRLANSMGPAVLEIMGGHTGKTMPFSSVMGFRSPVGSS